MLCSDRISNSLSCTRIASSICHESSVHPLSRRAAAICQRARARISHRYEWDRERSASKVSPTRVCHAWNNVSELLSGVLTTWLPVSHSTSRQLGLSRYKGGCKKSSVAPKRLLAAFAFVQLQSRVPWVPELGLHSVRIQLLGRSRQLFQCSR